MQIRGGGANFGPCKDFTSRPADLPRFSWGENGSNSPKTMVDRSARFQQLHFCFNISIACGKHFMEALLRIAPRYESAELGVKVAGHR